MSTSTQRIPKQVTKAPSGAAVSSPIIQSLKNEIRDSIALSKGFRVMGERRQAIRFLNDAADARCCLLNVMRFVRRSHD
ncbi:hypothetical protein BIT28_03365 [Photobacterium proteolyticum]|uniref:Uncharacterized protein n=1 Tax=Photobacterium proteolyticum TaxID=1903952 RepID=A0A1Q9GA28_9GAMM|nr:hypothetical protein [Photobacterium proteolyticum]OLQ71218.1 hypothetical protein BIT28_03365 [Photobacterium proteolyticum]